MDSSVAHLLETAPVILREEDRTDGAGDGVFGGEDADDVGAALDFSMEPFDRVVIRLAPARLLTVAAARRSPQLPAAARTPTPRLETQPAIS